MGQLLRIMPEWLHWNCQKPVKGSEDTFSSTIDPQRMHIKDKVTTDSHKWPKPTQFYLIPFNILAVLQLYLALTLTRMYQKKGTDDMRCEH